MQTYFTFAHWWNLEPVAPLEFVSSYAKTTSTFWKKLKQTSPQRHTHTQYSHNHMRAVYWVTIEMTCTTKPLAGATAELATKHLGFYCHQDGIFVDFVVASNAVCLCMFMCLLVGDGRWNVRVVFLLLVVFLLVLTVHDGLLLYHVASLQYFQGERVLQPFRHNGWISSDIRKLSLNRNGRTGRLD